jgi:uncharacterized protein (TIGR00369 family)
MERTFSDSLEQREALDLDNPLLEHLGVRLVEWTPGNCVLLLDIEARHLNRQSSLQGGVIATLLDSAGGYAGLKTSEDTPAGNAVTVMLTISYLDGVRQGRLRAEGHVTRAGRRLYFASGRLLAEDGRLLATAQGTFKRASPPHGASTAGRCAG